MRIEQIEGAAHSLPGAGNWLEVSQRASVVLESGILESFWPVKDDWAAPYRRYRGHHGSFLEKPGSFVSPELLTLYVGPTVLSNVNEKVLSR